MNGVELCTYLSFVVKPPEIRDRSHVSGMQHCREIYCSVLDHHQRSHELHLLQLTLRVKTKPAKSFLLLHTMFKT